MFRRDRVIASNDKRRQDGIHIRALTIDLVRTLPRASSSDPRPLAASSSQQGTVSDPRDQNPVREAMVHWPTWEQQNRKDLKQIEQELCRPYDYVLTSGDVPEHCSVKKRPVFCSSAKAKAKAALAVNIKMVSANGFQLNTRKPDVEVFSITIDGLDQMIEDRKQDQQP